jgi:hypothetical protein
MKIAFTSLTIATALVSLPATSAAHALITSWNQGPLHLEGETTIVLPDVDRTRLEVMRACTRLSLVFAGVRAMSEDTPMVRIFLNFKPEADPNSVQAPGYVGEFNFYGHRRERAGGKQVSFRANKAVARLDHAGRFAVPLSVNFLSISRADPHIPAPIVNQVALWCLASRP